MTLAKVRIAALDSDVSALGFGCASLGSRVAAAPGLAALARAHDAGVTWFDVAPSYGDGQAELLLGRFLASRPRQSVQVLTKVGIAPPAPSLKAQLLRPLVRAAVARVPALRATVRRRRPVATKLPLNAALIQQSLDASLRRLGTDYVDVLALHDATPAEVARQDVLRALETAVASGKVRALAVASSPPSATAAIGASSLYSIVQVENNLLKPGLEKVRASDNRAVNYVTHSVYGNEGAAQHISATLERDAGLRGELAATGYNGPVERMAADLLADYAFSHNCDGVVIVSMFSECHLRSNLERRARLVDSALMRILSTSLSA